MMADATRMPHQLLVYWATGEGGAKVRWGIPGDYDRCRRLIQAAIVKGGGAPLPPGMIDGLCANIHKIATGARPGQAPAEKAAAAARGR